ncbi:MAG TPA: hypothetical protein VL547_11115 [Dinghuibacter sp.]|uniref:hypothetical protein n=1 Tax=Dinghuibacter sp. TaxID=2024697 RepID=UPI002C48ADCF|nr:hypothetical protein [Dinghuibacter sp.]HTJ12570.1 hypothetical protein [Dinghuibacter sp.]
MKKIAKLFVLFSMSVFLSSCVGQNQTGSPKENIEAEIKDTVTSSGYNDPNIYTKYEYTDSISKSLIIQNSFPKGETYTDPNGKEYFKVIFWTRIINETDSPLDLKIGFPVDSYELPSSPGKYFKILLPSDTITIGKGPLYNYGLIGLKSFLDDSIHKQSSLKRTINPKESSGFYVVILFDNGVGGPFRTGLSIKGKNLFYRVSRYASTPAHSLLIDEKEINCGSINLGNLLLKK